MSFRNPFIRSGARSLVAAAALCVATVAAPAQDAAAPPSPWIKICNTDPNTKAEVCIVNQEIRAETGQPIAAVSIQTTNEPGKYAVGIVVPIGFILPPGVTLTVDGEKKGAAQYAICIPPSNQQPAACIAQAVLADDFIAALKKGNRLALVMANPQNRAIAIEMSLAGFSKTFDGPGIDRAAADAQRQQLSEALQKSAEEARRKLIEQQQKEIGNTPN